MQLVVIVGRRRRHLAQVLPGGEGAPGAGDHDAPQLGILLRTHHRVPGAVPQVVVERVQGLGPVPPDEPDAVGVRDLHHRHA